MSASIEQFEGLPKAIGQGRGARRLSSDNVDWLPESYYSSVPQRYDRGILRAIYNVRRLARYYPNFHPMFLRYQDPEQHPGRVGIATIILGQTVEHPTRGPITGIDVDYWLDESGRIDEAVRATCHREVAEALVGEAYKLADDTSPGSKPPVFGVVQLGQPHQPEGIAAIMEPFGEPARLWGHPDADPYDVAKAGSLSQIYQYPLQ
jgi:hypothetical protein